MTTAKAYFYYERVTVTDSYPGQFGRFEIAAADDTTTVAESATPERRSGE